MLNASNQFRVWVDGMSLLVLSLSTIVLNK